MNTPDEVYVHVGCTYSYLFEDLRLVMSCLVTSSSGDVLTEMTTLTTICPPVEIADCRLFKEKSERI